MKLRRRSHVLMGLWVILALTWTGVAQGQSSKTFTGTIKEIARGTELDLGKRENFYILRLSEYPSTEFRLASDDAVRSGVVEAGSPTGVLTPQKCKGLGWRVKLICDSKNLGLVKRPVYKVISLEKQGD